VSFEAFLLSSAFFWTVAYANIEDHFRKAEGKLGIHKLRNIDFIYMINLDQRPEKFSSASGQLQKYGIYPYRFSAVNGWELSVEVINDVGLKYQPGMMPLKATFYPLEAHGMPRYEFMREFGKTYFCHNMARGSIGCALSHISILKDAWDSGYERIWVLEDDIEVIGDPMIIPDLIDKLNALVGKENWDVLFTDQNYRQANGQYLIANGAAERPDMDCSLKERYSEKYTINQEISPDFRRVSARFATHSMIIQRSGIKKLLEFALTHKIFSAYDLENYLVPGIKRYSLTKDLVSNMLGASSDNETPLYQVNAR
jgi:GR25 family glycosyltransferase involved in LPS biosynthesis